MRILKRLFSHVQPYWKPLLLTAIALLLETGLSLVPPLFQKSIIDGVLSEDFWKGQRTGRSFARWRRGRSGWASPS